MVPASPDEISWAPMPLPAGLVDWLAECSGSWSKPDASIVPANPTPKCFTLATVRFGDLDFRDHAFNPRVPSDVKVNELLASIRRLALLNPLVCAYLEPEDRGRRGESVVLIDGRHRYEALCRLAAEDRPWRENARIDLKVYYGLGRSELFLLSTYLNRNRRALRRGEYYRSVTRIYDERRDELTAHLGREPNEREVFQALHGRELRNRDFDLSIGRIVGLVGFGPARTARWAPLVGNSQNQLLAPDTGLHGFAPLTAGNLAEFLRHLCLDRPYEDNGRARARELANVNRLGDLFRDAFLRPVADYTVATDTTVGCKFWVLSAFGRVLRTSSLFSKQVADGAAPFSAEPDWRRIELIVEAYQEIMADQANLVNRYRDTESEEFLDRAWSYQTQRNQVLFRLVRALQEKVPASKVTFS